MSDPIHERLQQVLAGAEATAPPPTTDALRRGLETLPDDPLEQLARNPWVDPARRCLALSVHVARHRMEPEASTLLHDLLDDPVEAVALAAIAEAPAFVAMLRERLRLLVHDSRPARAHAAALALARRKDRSILPELLGWTTGAATLERRLAALLALRWLLEPAEALALFGTAWDAAAAAEPVAAVESEDQVQLRLAIAECLVALGDDRPLEYLASLALAEGPWAARALALIEAFDAAQGDTAC